MAKTLIRFSAGNDPISWLIQQRTGCVWSHCDLVMPDTGKLLGALPGDGVQLRSRIERETRFAIYEVPVENGWLYAETQIGTPYDWLGAIACGLPFPRDWNNDEYWWCSELLAHSLAEAGLPIVSSSSWGVTPRDLLMSPLLRKVTI